MSSGNNNGSNNSQGGGGGGHVALQIVSSSGGSNMMHGGNGNVGGSMGEWSQKFTALGCVAMFSTVLIGAALAVAVGALWFVYNGDSETQCLGEFAGIPFSYITWLRILGWTFVGGMAAEILLVFIHGWSGTVCTSKLATVFGVLFFVFQTAWYAVGAILYWKTVTTNCKNGSQLQMFSLALFIIQSTVVTCLVLGRKASEHAV